MQKKKLLRAITIVVAVSFLQEQLCWAYPAALRPSATAQAGQQTERIVQALDELKSSSAGTNGQKKEDQLQFDLEEAKRKTDELMKLFDKKIMTKKSFEMEQVRKILALVQPFIGYYSKTAGRLTEEGRIDDIKELIGYITESLSEEHRREMVSYFNLEPLYLLFSERLVNKAKTETDKDRKAKLLELAENLAKQGIVSYKKLKDKITLPKSYSVLKEVYDIQRRWEDIIPLSKEAILNGLSDKRWCRDWFLSLLKGYHIYKNYKYDEETLFLAQAFYTLDKKMEKRTIEAGAILADTCLERFFYKPELVQKAKDALKESLILAEKDKYIDDKKRLRYKTDFLKALATANMILGTKENYKQAIDLCDEALKLKPGDGEIQGYKLTAKKFYAASLMEEDRKRAEELFDECKMEFAKGVDIITSNVGKIIDGQDVQAWLGCINASIEYLKGNFAEAEKEYERLLKKAKGDIVLILLYDYAYILFKLGKQEEAREAMLNFFRQLGKKDKEETPQGAIFEQQYYLNRERLRGILALAEKELSKPERWKDIDPLTFQYILKFLFTYGNYGLKDIEKVFWRFLNYLAKTQPGADFWPTAEALISALLSYDPKAGRVFLRYALRICKDEALKNKLESFLRGEACQKGCPIDEYLFFLLLNIASGCPENREFIYKTSANSIDAFLTKTNDDPVALFEEIKRAREKIKAIIGVNGPEILIYIDVLRILLAYNEELFWRSDKKTRDFKNRLGIALLNFNREAKDVLKVFDENLRPVVLILYDLLADNLGKAEEFQQAIDVYKKMFKLSKGPEKVLEQDCTVLSSLCRYASYLEYIQKHSESNAIFKVWKKSISNLMDRAESGQPLPGGVSKRALYEQAINSMLEMEEEVLTKQAIAEEDNRKTALRVIDNWFDELKGDYEINDLLLCAHMAYAHLNDMVRFKRLMEKAISLIKEPEAEFNNEGFWHVFTINTLASIYSKEEREEEAQDVFKTAEEILERAYRKGNIDQMDLQLARAIANILKKDYDNGIKYLEEGKGLLQKGYYDEVAGFVFPMLLAVCYNSKGETERAQGILEETIETEANKWCKAKNKQRQNIINRSRFIYPGYIRMLSDDFKKPFVGLLYEQLFRQGISDEATAIILNMLEFIEPEYVVSILISYFENILSGEKKFESKRDMCLLRWMAAAPSRKRLIIEELCQNLSKSDRVDKSCRNTIGKLTSKAEQAAQAEEYPFAVRNLYESGEFSKALSLIRTGIQLAQGQNKKGIVAELEQLQQEIQSALNILEHLNKVYGQDNYEEALGDCGELLALNSRNSFALYTKENIACIMRARGCLKEGDLDKAQEALDSAPHYDKKVKQLKSQLNRVSSTIQDVASLLDENKYKQAERGLSKIAPAKLMGAEITKESPLVKELYEAVKDCQDKAAEYEKVLKESDSVAELYENAQLLLQYPEHKDNTFELLLLKAVNTFNEKNYKHSFNIARLVYELKDYQPDIKYLKKAQQLISHSLSNIWMPELIDDYFIIKTMAEAERYRDERDRFRRGLRLDAPIQFEFEYFEATPNGFVLSGFKEVKDMRDFAFRGDAFRIKPRGQQEELQPLFKLSYAGEDKLVFSLPNIKDGYDYILPLLESSLANGGTVTRVSNAAWINQSNMLDYTLRQLKGSTKTRLRADKDDLVLATTNNRTLDYGLGLLLDIPQDKNQAAAIDKSKETTLVESKEQKEAILLDPEQKVGMTDGLSTSIPYTLYQGPGGTGKTFEIVWLTELLLDPKEPKRVRILSQTNPGVDNIGKKLNERNVFFARVGNDEEVIDGAIYDIWLKKHERLTSIRNHFKPNLILGTINGFGLDHDIEMYPDLLTADYVIVDEDSRATVPESMWALFMFKGVKKFILVGDHYQLPAYGIKEEDIEFAKDEFRKRNIGQLKIQGFGNASLDDIFNKAKVDAFRLSLLEKVLKLFDDESGLYKLTRPNFHFFKVNRRSGKYIVELDNYFYDGRLIAGRKEDGIVIEDNYQGRYKEEKTGLKLKKEDTINKGEIARVIYWLNHLINDVGLNPENPKDIAVITPYSKQEELITQTLLNMANIFEILKEMEDKGVTESKLPLLSSYIQEGTEIIKILLDELHSKGAWEEFKVKLKAFSKERTSQKAKEVREFLGFGDKFIPSKSLVKRLFSVSTIDSAIGSEWKAVIISWVRSNYKKEGYGRVGFLADKIDGWRRRNVGIGRAQNILINIWDKDTFEYATDPEIRKWAKHNVSVFEKAKETGCADLKVYQQMFRGDKTLSKPVSIDTEAEVLAEIATQA